MKKRNTRDLILDRALKLFNEKGTARTSTNHICTSCKISPGNLYYYFADKESIINEIFRQMIQRWDSQIAGAATPSLEAFNASLELMFTFLWEYRFLHREFSMLMRNRPFRSMFEEIQKRRLREIDTLVEIYVETGVLRPLDRNETMSIRRLLWFFSLQWLPFLEIEGGETTRASIREGIDLLQMVLRPFLASSVENIQPEVITIRKQRPQRAKK